MLSAAPNLPVLALLLALAPPLAAQGTTPPGCQADSAAHALDFWVGNWTVQVGGEHAGTNRIDAILGGCAITELWRDAGGGEGHSLFYYLPAQKEWRQVWVTPAALRPGGVKEKRQVEFGGPGIRFQGTIALPDGRSYLDRTTLTPQADGTVRQLIEVSTDSGTTWRPTFDGIYDRIAPAARGVPLDSLAWRPAGQGVEVAVAEGIPSATGRFTMMLRLQDGAWLPPHWHNVDKALTVVSGTLLLGEGDRLDPAISRRHGPGSVIVVPAQHRHFEGGAGLTVVALTAVGPFRTVMVTP